MSGPIRITTGGAMTDAQAWLAYWEGEAPRPEKSVREVLEEMVREVRILRQYGNKDCTAMADEAIATTGEDDE